MNLDSGDPLEEQLCMMCTETMTDVASEGIIRRML